MLFRHDGGMRQSHPFRMVPAVAALIAAAALSGCAGDSNMAAGAFADPAAYALYDCKRLEPQRGALATREKQLRDLMAKAEEGAGGMVIAEVAYRSELLTVQGSRKYAEQAWVEKGCDRQTPGAAAISGR